MKNRVTRLTIEHSIKNWSCLSESLVVGFTNMVVATLHGLPGMDPIFSSVLTSRKKIANIIDNDLRSGL